MNPGRRRSVAFPVVLFSANDSSLQGKNEDTAVPLLHIQHCIPANEDPCEWPADLRALRPHNLSAGWSLLVPLPEVRRSPAHAALKPPSAMTTEQRHLRSTTAFRVTGCRGSICSLLRRGRFSLRRAGTRISVQRPQERPTRGSAPLFAFKDLIERHKLSIKDTRFVLVLSESSAVQVNAGKQTAASWIGQDLRLHFPICVGPRHDGPPGPRLPRRRPRF
jgi:hypothetical protein